MKVYETPRFIKQRRKLRSNIEKEALKKALLEVSQNPLSNKKLKGEFKDLRRYRYFVHSQEQRLIYRVQGDVVYFLSFGPREGVYK